MSPSSVFRAGGTALITGGASGIGFAIAKLCRGHGMHLALVDNNAANLELAKNALTSSSSASSGSGSVSDVKTETYDIDVGEEAAWHEVRDSVKDKFGDVDLLVLNAGVARKGGWENGGYFREIFQTNFFGVTNGINAFLPVIQSQQKDRPSAIVITGSKQGITNPPGNPAYNASKAAIKALAEHLSYDMRGSSTSVHLLVPGWTFTGITSTSGAGPLSKKEKPQGAWTPEQVAGYLEKGVEEGKFWIICPDNDVSEDTDRRRMMWTAGDAVCGRPPLSRWREEFKDQAVKEMAEMKL